MQALELRKSQRDAVLPGGQQLAKELVHVTRSDDEDAPFPFHSIFINLQPARRSYGWSGGGRSRMAPSG